MLFKHRERQRKRDNSVVQKQRDSELKTFPEVIITAKLLNTDEIECNTHKLIQIMFWCFPVGTTWCYTKITKVLMLT